MMWFIVGPGLWGLVVREICLVPVESFCFPRNRVSQYHMGSMSCRISLFFKLVMERVPRTKSLSNVP